MIDRLPHFCYNVNLILTLVNGNAQASRQTLTLLILNAYASKENGEIEAGLEGKGQILYLFYSCSSIVKRGECLTGRNIHFPFHLQ